MYSTCFTSYNYNNKKGPFYVTPISYIMLSFSLQPVCKKILTRLYRVFVHVYVHHFDRMMAIGAEPHVNTCYKHYYYFVTEFHLLNEKEFEPLKEMTIRICTDLTNSQQHQSTSNYASKHTSTANAQTNTTTAAAASAIPKTTLPTTVEER